jgi:hypothetical protein
MRPRCLLLVLACAAFSPAHSHSASDAYLTLSDDAQNPGVLHGQWDIAIRDLDFLLALDDNGDGKVSWGEVRQHLPAIERYAYGRLAFGNGDAACKIAPVRRQIDDHADGAYVVLFFDVTCGRPESAGSPLNGSLKMSYGLFFDIDPSHRGIFLLRSKSGTSTAVLSPQNSSVSLSTGR